MIIRDICKSYQGRTVLRLQSFDFQPGAVYSVIGANGSGKSTLVRILAGLLPADQDFYFPDKKRLKIGYLPQKPYIFRQSVLKNVLLGAGREADVREKALGLLADLDLTALAGQQAHSLSGGESAGLALARLLLGKHELLLLDEPTAAMDIRSTQVAEELLLRYVEQRGCIVIWITHSLKQAARVSSQTLFFDGGELAEWGPSQLLLTNPADPRTRQFLDFFRL